MLILWSSKVLMNTRSMGHIWPMDFVFMGTFDNQSRSMGCVGKLEHLFGLLRHYLLKCEWLRVENIYINIIYEKVIWHE